MRLKPHEIGIWQKKLNQTVKDVMSPHKSNVKVNAIWSGHAKVVQHSKSLKKNAMSTPEVMKKLDEVLLKLTEIQNLFTGNEIPSNIVGKNSFINALDDKVTLDGVKKAVDDVLDNGVDKDSGKKDAKVVHKVDGDDPENAVKEGLDVKPHAKVKVMKRRSYSDVPEVANRGNTAFEVDVFALNLAPSMLGRNWNPLKGQ